jgi:hypothetical protein
MESQPEGMHPEHRQFRQYVIRRRTGRNYLRIRASIETIRCLAGAIFVRGFADLVTKTLLARRHLLVEAMRSENLLRKLERATGFGTRELNGRYE